VTPYCGDGFVWEGNEECDDGNDVEDDVCTTECISNGIIFAADFTAGQASPNACTAWNDWRAEVGSGNFVFNRIQVWSSQDPNGVECVGAQADQICQALADNQATSVACNGRTWATGQCGNGIELSADQGAICSCTPNPGNNIRPCIGNYNWGGVGTAICNAPTQTMEVVCQ
jgi:cysteine-rich repeat protein